ncbi:MAG: DUF523 domain-containing protein [Proteobacteria bacterium]|nr:DUF523 domain-containing protein [Pseudomonadota bacterium]
MFSDERSRRVIFVSHCILNSNTRADGHAGVPGVNQRVMELLMRMKVGVVQMPCPEMMCLGLDRGDVRGGERPVLIENTRIREGLKSNSSTAVLDGMVEQVMVQVQQYLQHGFNILGIVGVNRSPSCGVETTTIDNEEVQGEGVFIERLRKALEAKDIHLGYVGTKISKVEEALLAIQAMADKSESAFNRAAAKAVSGEFRQ